MIAMHAKVVQPPPTRRVFFAVPMPELQRASFVHATRKAVRASGGRPVLPLDLHVTLVFVGAVEEQALPLLVAAGAAASTGQGVGSFRLGFDRLEHWARPRVFCATATVIPVQALALVRALEKALEEHEVSYEHRGWKPHVTLARNTLAPHLVGAITPLPWHGTEFGLFESMAAPAAPRYQALELWPLPSLEEG